MNSILLSKKPQNAMRDKKIVMVLFTIPTVVLYTAFFWIPMLMGVYYSTTDWNGIAQSYKFVALENYVKIFQNDRFIKSIWFNFKYTFFLVIGIVLISLIIALCLNQNIKASTAFRSVFFLPAVISSITVALIWNELFYRAFPVVGQTLGIDWLSSSILANKGLAMFGILMVNIWQGCATPTVLFLAGLQSVPKDLYEAATIDGANAWNRFRNITVPFLIPVLNMVVITTVKGGLTIFDYVKALTDGGPMQSTEAIGILIYRHALVEGKYSQSVAESMILFLIVGIVSFVTLKLTNNKQVGD